MAENKTEEVYVQDHEYLYVVPVKFHNTTKSYSFGTDEPDFHTGDAVVVETVQGVELGECQGSCTPAAKATIKAPLRPVIRKATEKDKKDFKDNFEYGDRAKKICQEEIEALELNMHLLSASYLLDRSKVLFVYTSDQRVDFRELLKRLGSRLHCRIELRQIGDRDQAKMVGGIGMCGMECCCARFKNHFDNISINMAKTQQLALNIEKLSGMCGKLMCCLKYENETYQELTKDLPKLGAHIEFEGDLYRVSSINVIANEARIENSETYQVITIDALREKAIIRKGVTIKKAADGQHPKRQNNTGSNRNSMAPVGVDTTKVGISSLSKKNEHSERPERPERDARPDRNAKTKPNNNGKNNNNNRKNSNAPGNGKPAQNSKGGAKNQSANNNNNRKRNNNPRRPEKPVENNPNITVRSFKSSKAKAEEKSE